MKEFEKMWKYGFTFSGRSTRKDYWMAYLFNIIAIFVLAIIANSIDAPWLVGLYALAEIIPGFALTIRRLHDINKSGWSILLSLIPIVGGLILLIFYCSPSVNESNRFGEILE